MESVLSVAKLCKIYPGSPPCIAVDNISFELNKGEILGLLGPNGSGKTTTIQMLLGTLLKTSGSITYFDMEFPKHRSEILQHVCFASTYTNLPWSLTITENLVVYGYLYGLDKAESKRRYEPLLERFDIADRHNHRISSLSTGQLTRLMLVKAFFTEPKILLLDEPTAALDPEISSDICSFLLEMREKSELSILISSHKMSEVMELCDRAIFLKNGKIIADDLPSKLAKSVSTYRVRLVVTDGLKRLSAIATQNKHPFVIDHRTVTLEMAEETIPNFLHSLSDAKINYASIAIEEPSLEDYFLHIAKKVSS